MAISNVASISGQDFTGKRALVRVDFNVPVVDGVISDDTRLRAALPTIKSLVAAGAKVILMAHYGRPKGKVVPEMSLAFVAPALAALVGASVAFSTSTTGPDAEANVAALNNGDILLLENLRFDAGEEKNDPAFVGQLAKLGDVFVNDAFSAAHRAHASTEGLAHALPSYAGLSMEKELSALDKALGNPERPLVAVVGGAKVSTKIDLLQNLVGKVDALVVGGGMANTFLAARGVDVGKSLCEHDLLDTAKAIEAEAATKGCIIILPIDVVAAKAFATNAENRVVDACDGVAADEMILDAGPKSVAALAATFANAKTVIWNGPLGAFEIAPFDMATVAAAQAAAKLVVAGKLVAVAGGGDTVSALHHAGVANDFTFVSTAGGAFLEWMEGKPLPGVDALKSSAKG